MGTNVRPDHRLRDAERGVQVTATSTSHSCWSAGTSINGNDSPGRTNGATTACPPSTSAPTCATASSDTNTSSIAVGLGSSMDPLAHLPIHRTGAGRRRLIASHVATAKAPAANTAATSSTTGPYAESVAS